MVGTVYMTGVMAAGQNGLIGDRFETNRTRSGLSHHRKGLNCLISWLTLSETWNGTVVFIEKKGHVG